MPSEKVLSQKKQIVADLTEQLRGSTAGVLVDYKGITVEQDTMLRRSLREAGVDYSVVKNTLIWFAAKEVGFNELEPVLNGTTSLAVSKEDPVAAAKILSEFAEKHKCISIKGGFLEGKVIQPAEIQALADLPSKEVLVAKALGGLNAPITGFVHVLNGNLRGLAIALNAIAEQKS